MAEKSERDFDFEIFSKHKLGLIRILNNNKEEYRFTDINLLLSDKYPQKPLDNKTTRMLILLLEKHDVITEKRISSTWIYLVDKTKLKNLVNEVEEYIAKHTKKQESNS